MKKVVLSIIAILFLIGVIFCIILISKGENPMVFIADLLGIGKPSKKELIQRSNSWIYDIDFESTDDLEKLSNSNYDVIVVDADDVDEEDIKKIRGETDKLIIAYLSIGQAENYRDYWKDGWDVNNPAWIASEDSDWEGNYNIKYWSEEWKDIVFGEMADITSNKFDGVLLDIAGLEYWVSLAEETGEEVADIDPEEKMITLIEDLSVYAKGWETGFLIIPQNLGFLAGDYAERLQGSIDAVAQEEVFYGYENKDGIETTQAVSLHIISKLKAYKQEKLPIFVVDYPFICEETLTCLDRENLERMRDSYRKGWEEGFIMYDQNRNLSGVTYSLPRIIETKAENDNLTVLSWKRYSPNGDDFVHSYRVLVASSSEKLDNDEADIYDSGKIIGNNTSFGFIPDKDINEGSYFWKMVTYDQRDDIIFPSPWSDTQEFEYKNVSDKSETYKGGDETSQSGWIPSWGFDKGFESLKESKEHFESISPVWYELDDEGNITYLPYRNNDEFIKFCNENDIKVIPSIASFSADQLSIILNMKLNEHVDQLYKEVVDGGYDGIDLDYEMTYLEDKEKFMSLLKKLSNKLHKDDKILSVTVLSKWSDSEIYAGFSQTREVQDWEEIAKYADEIRIMAYDYTWQTVFIPGPISPIYWEELILKYAIEEIPAEKVMLALPLYGYSFRLDELSVKDKDFLFGGDIAGSERRVLAYTYEEILSLREEFDFEIAFDNYHAERIFAYNDGVYDRRLYINDARAIKMRKELAAKYDIKGVVYWRLGGGDARCFE